MTQNLQNSACHEIEISCLNTQNIKICKCQNKTPLFDDLSNGSTFLGHPVVCQFFFISSEVWKVFSDFRHMFDEFCYKNHSQTFKRTLGKGFQYEYLSKIGGSFINDPIRFLQSNTVFDRP